MICAASKGETDKIDAITDLHILNGADYDGRTALHLACSEGKVQTTRLLVEKGVEKNVKTDGNTPLHEISKFRYLNVSENVEDRVNEIKKI